MRVCTRLAFSVLLLLAGVVPTAAQSGTTAIFFDSQPGDYIGQGLERTWTESDLAFTASVSSDRSHITIAARASNLSVWWTLNFAAPVGTPLVPGVYEYATRHPFQETHLNGLDVSGSGRGCNELAGRFRIHEVVVDGSGVVKSFAADFEQHCEGGGPALFGAVRYHSTRASLEPFDGAYPFYAIHVDDAVNGYVTGPGIECGGGRSDCDEVFAHATSIALTATPNPGYVFLGWAGFDCVGTQTVIVDVNRSKLCRPVFNSVPEGPGIEAPNYAAKAAFLDGPFNVWPVVPVGGRTQMVFVPPYGQLEVEAATPASVSVRINHPAISSATVRFGAAAGEVLEPGMFHPAVSDFDAINPAVQLTYQNSVCTAPGGRFRIYEIAFVGATLTTFSADFEVPCHSGRTFTGSIRYNAGRASLLPFDGVYPSPTLTVTATVGGYVTSPSGIDCGDGGRTDCEEPYDPQAIVSLQATSSPGYQFYGWAGVCTGSNPIATISLAASSRCIAVFNPVSTAPSHAFGDEFLVIHRSGASPSRSVWLPPEGRVRVTTFGQSIRFTATNLFDSTSLWFGLPAGRIAIGEYHTLDAAGPVLEVPGCFGSRGFFKVYEAGYNPDGTIASFAADFEAYCSSSITTYVAGAIRYRASRHIITPFEGAYPVVRLAVAPSPYGQVAAPGIACSPSASDCSETFGTATVASIHATPNAGYAFAGWTGDCSGGSLTSRLVDRAVWCEALFRAVRSGLPEDGRLASGSLTIQSQPGEPIGGGVTHTYLTDDWSVFAFDSRRTLSISPFETDWRLEFRVPPSGALAAGVYENAVGTSGALSSPALSIRRNSTASCPSGNISGRFIIHELRFASSTSSSVQSLSLDFEQRCNNGPPLRGSVRYRSQRSVLQPFADSPDRAFTAFDFNGDRNADLVWQDRVNGRLLFWHLNGTAHVFNESPSTGQVPDTNWHIVGNADANGDGYNDLYWQHQTTGALAVWYMRDALLVSGDAVSPATVADTDWKVRTVVDLDRDGHPDLIWQHRSTGQIAVWFMNGRTLRSGELLGPGVVADTNWTIVGAGDANGDGSPDLYWHHLGSGQLAIWFMRGVHLLGGEHVSPASVADTNWRVRGVADLDRNGSADLIWQNVATSELAVWLLNGLRLVDGRHITGPVMPAASWVLVGPR